jgi:plasmid stabilization system protein ParE
MYKVLLLDDAIADINEARFYYNSLVKGLGARFKIDLKKTLGRLANNPQTYGSRFKEFRTANLLIFPFHVHCKIEEAKNTVIIFAVLHAYMDQDFIVKRNVLP